ncbi:MAG: hypothetical protein DMG13_17085 [Acidobacteria bacterium]|nr:MAG: hypothetical protein DMG13_17085 [Acidobacteriota bacterium]
MQIKHTFLFTMILGIGWCGYLFGYSLGPDPASNGIFGDARACSIPGCHVGNPVNFSGGSVTLAGLPVVWLPGQTYSLLVMVQRPGQVRFGFQLSAVAEATNQQAGTLTAGASNVQIITGGGIQYAEHRNANQISAFNVNWTAPSSASVGTVRFNLAGNAANGDFNNTGDFIYTRVDRVPPEAAPPVDSSVRSFVMADRAGVSMITDGSGDLTTGYSRIQPGAGSTAPAGVAIFGLRQNNIVVTEAGVPASPLITAGRIYAEVDGPVNTGLAIANPNAQAAVINFHFTNSAGVDFAAGSTTIPANQQIARFLDQDPFNGGPGVQGTLSFSSNVPVSAIALRGFTNERSEFLITTLPLTDLAAAASSSTVTLPHFADGGGWTTQIVLVNTTNNTLTGNIQFYGPGTADAAATPVTLTANGQTASSFSYSIQRQSSFKLVTAGTGSVTSTGSVRILPQGAAPSSLVIFSFKPAEFTVSEAGASNVQIITGGGIQYAEHRNANQISAFNVNWTAPSSASVGTVRFNGADRSEWGGRSAAGQYHGSR